MRPLHIKSQSKTEDWKDQAESYQNSGVSTAILSESVLWKLRRHIICAKCTHLHSDIFQEQIPQKILSKIRKLRLHFSFFLVMVHLFQSVPKILPFSWLCTISKLPWAPGSTNAKWRGNIGRHRPNAASNATIMTIYDARDSRFFVASLVLLSQAQGHISKSGAAEISSVNSITDAFCQINTFSSTITTEKWPIWQ